MSVPACRVNCVSAGQGGSENFSCSQMCVCGGGPMAHRWILLAGNNSSSNSSINCNQPEVPSVAHPMMGTMSVPAVLCT
jgi:hypothetical protein